MSTISTEKKQRQQGRNMKASTSEFSPTSKLDEGPLKFSAGYQSQIKKIRGMGRESVKRATFGHAVNGRIN